MSEIMKLLKKPPKFFFDTIDIRKIVPPIKLDQSKHNPEEDMIAFSLYPYMNIAKELLESIEGSRTEVIQNDKVSNGNQVVEK